MYIVTFCPQVQVTLPNLNFEAQEMEIGEAAQSG
jgi:hypothetical protein